MNIPTFLQQWDHWWLRKSPPHGLAIFRMIFGAYMLLYWGLRLPHVPILFSREGLALPYDRFLPPALNVLLTPPPASIAWLVFAAFLGSLACLTIGAATRTSAGIAWLLYLYYTLLSLHHAGTSYNRLFLFLLFLLLFSDAGKACSVEMRRKHGSFLAWEPGSVLVHRLIAAQLTATYVGVGWQKAGLPGWQGGEILYYSFQGMWATPLAFSFVRQEFPMWVYDAMVFAVKCFEVLLPVGLWSRRYRLAAFAGGLLFHAGVSLFLAAIWWFYTMPASYFLFYKPEEIHRTIRRWSRGRIS